MRHPLWILISLSLCLPSTPGQNQCGVFTNGVSGSIDVPYNPLLIAPSGGITVEAWVTYNDTLVPGINRFPTIIRGKPSPGWSYFLRVNGNTNNTRQLRFAVNAANSGIIIANWNFTAGALLCWTHVAATYDGAGTSRVFVNGVEVATTVVPGAGAIVDGGGTLGIGEGLKSSVYNNEVWNGRIDQVRVWTTALSQAQIGAGMFSAITSASILQGAWHLDGNLQDSSGNGNHGAMFGSFSYQAQVLPVMFEYQTNSAAASLDINLNAPTPSCSAQALVALNQTVSINLASNLTGLPFDVVYTIPEFVVPASAGGLTTPGQQIVNVNLLAPSFNFLFGGLASPISTPFPGPFSIMFAVPAPITAAAQLVVVNPTSPDGLSLSSGVNLRVQ